MTYPMKKLNKYLNAINENKSKTETGIIIVENMIPNLL